MLLDRLRRRDHLLRDAQTMRDSGQPYAQGFDAHTLAAAGVPITNQMVHYQRTREMTIDELLLENRVVFLIGEINYGSAARCMMQMLYLENQKKGQDINLYINSHGGTVDDTLAIYDTMQFLTADVATFCIGRAYSGASIILSAGTKGKRHMLPHAKVMIHQPLGGVGGQAEDVRIQAEQIIKAKHMLAGLMARHTGQTEAQIIADSERDKYFTAEEAKSYGIVDEVLAFDVKGIAPPGVSAPKSILTVGPGSSGASSSGGPSPSPR